MEALPKLLVVDDEEDSRRLISLILKREFTVITASGVDDALDKLKDPDIRAVITDVCMPCRDGFELVLELESNFPNLPAIIMTAHADKRMAIRAIKENVFDFLEKPILDKDELIKICKRAVKHNK